MFILRKNNDPWQLKNYLSKSTRHPKRMEKKYKKLAAHFYFANNQYTLKYSVKYFYSTLIIILRIIKFQFGRWRNVLQKSKSES